MAVTAHFGETIHYNAFTDVTSITDAVREDLEEKGFNITVGAYPIITNVIEIGENNITIPNAFKWNPDAQTITLPTQEEFIRAASKSTPSLPDAYSYKVGMIFFSTYINPSGATDTVQRGTVVIEVAVGS